MRVIEVIPVGYQIIVGYSLDDLKHLKTIMDHMTFNMDGDDPAHVAANTYLHSRFYPELEDTLKELIPNVSTPDPE
jgi:hypothetical protein